jgi:hypothetical protein
MTVSRLPRGIRRAFLCAVPGNSKEMSIVSPDLRNSKEMSIVSPDLQMSIVSPDLPR